MPANAYQLLIFDFDGTLADSFGFAVEAFDILAEAHGFQRLERGNLAALRGKDVRQLAAHVGLPIWKLPRVLAHFRQLMAAGIDRIALFEGMREVLIALAGRGVTLALVSSNSEQNVRTVLGPQAALFSHYACGASLWGKARKLRQVVAAAGVPAAQVLCIGDETRDCDAARRAGLDFGAVSWGYADPQVLRACAPARLFTSVSELIEQLGNR